MKPQDWPERLAQFWRDRRSMPFAWGSNDCCSLAADWVVEMTGADPMAGLRGVDNAISAGRTLEALGGMRAAVTGRLGEPIDWMLAQRGDVVLLILDRETLGVCMGTHAIAPGQDGALLVPMDSAECAWRIG